jgi:hypothetical protein
MLILDYLYVMPDLILSFWKQLHSLLEFAGWVRFLHKFISLSFLQLRLLSKLHQAVLLMHFPVWVLALH